MAKAVFEFVLESSKPAQFGEEGPSLPIPEFHDDEEAWQKALEYARHLNVFVPFLATLDRVPWKGKIPENTLFEVTTELGRQKMRLARLDAELDIALRCLVNSRLPVILLKEMDLGRRFYAERVFRPATEVNLLLPKELFSHGLRALGRSGYRVTSHLPEEKFCVELARHNSDSVVRVYSQLIFGELESTNAGIWERAQDAVIPGVPRVVRALSKEDLLSYLVRDGVVNELLRSPNWLNDLYHVIHGSKDFDWDRFIWDMSRTSSHHAAWFAFQILQKSYGFDLPKKVMTSLDHRMNWFRKLVLNQYTVDTKWFSSVEPGAFHSFYFRWLLQEGVWDHFHKEFIDAFKNGRPDPTKSIDHAA